jgi:ribonuclease HI
MNTNVKSADKAKAETVEVEQGIVMYTDGGAKPNPGNTGWGIHGYLYENVVPKKGSGNSNDYLTMIGYVPKIEKKKEEVTEVKPVCYFDGYGSSALVGTNNTAEIEGATNALRKAKDYNIKYMHILTDSQYVQKGITEWSPVWLKRNWVRIDGTPVPNSDYWKSLLTEYDHLTSRGVNIEVTWVKAHSGIYGNEVVDQLASIGVIASSKKMVRSEVKTSPAEGYWKSEVERHPFIGNRRMYFNTLRESNVTGEYYLGEHGKDDDHLGKKTSDGALCVVQIRQPDFVLEDIRQHLCGLSDGSDSVMMVRLDEVYKPETFKILSNYGSLATIKPKARCLDLETLAREPLCKEFVPPFLAFRAFGHLAELKGLLESYKTGNKDLHLKDITSILYNSQVIEKKNKEPVIVVKLKPEYSTGFTALPIEFEYVSEEEGKVNLKIILTLGLDILSRNYLKRLEDFEPKVSVVVWRHAKGVFRYATIIESQGSYGVWAGVYSNIIFSKD